MEIAYSKTNITGLPAIFRLCVHKIKNETGLTRTDIEVLTTIGRRSAGEMYVSPKDIAISLPTLSKDYLYDTIAKLKCQGYISPLREPVRTSSGYFHSGLYSCTPKGVNVIRLFIQEMELLQDKAEHGYI